MVREKKKNPLVIAFFTIFLDLVGFGLIIPIQGFYAEKYGASPAVVTLLGAAYSLMQFIFAPFWGRLSDRIGRRPIILSSVAISCLGHLIFGIGGSLAMLFAARMLSGFGNANIGTAQAIISDSTAEKDRAKGMGLIGAAFGLGFILGPAIGGFLGQFGPSVPSYFAAGLAVVNWISAYLQLPETLKEGAKATGHRAFSIAAFRHAARHINVGKILFISLIYSTGFALMEQVIGLLIERVWVTDPNVTGDAHIRIAARLTAYFLVAVGVTATIIQGGLIGKLSRRFGERNLIRSGTFILAISLLLVPLSASTKIYALLIGTAVLMAIGGGIFNPSISSFLSRSVDKTEQGGTLGLNQSCAALGRVGGPALSGLFFQIHHYLPFVSGSFLLGIAFILSMRLSKPQV